MKFDPGQIVATPGALAAFEASGEEPLAFLLRHVQGDWGDVDEHDQQENELSLQQQNCGPDEHAGLRGYADREGSPRNGWRLLSAYRLSDGTKIWVITEADRSSTTILLPDEY